MAVVGAGNWGKRLLGEYVALSGLPDNPILAAVADLEEANLDEVETKYGVRTTTDYRRLLNDESVHAVHIAVPNHLHFKVAKDFLESGKHVLLEKPMTMTAKEATRLTQIARRKRLILRNGNIFRFNNSVRTLKKYIQNGQLGKVYVTKLFWMALQVPLPPERDIIFDLAPHAIDILHILHDRWPERVFATAASFVRGKEAQEEWAHIVLDYPSRSKAIVELSWIDPREKKREIQVTGSHATATVDAVGQRMWYSSSGMEVEIPIQKNNPMKEEIVDFVLAIHNGTYNSNTDGQIGVRIVEVLENLRRSVSVGTPVMMNSPTDMPPKLSHSVVHECTVGEGTSVQDHVNLYKCRLGRNCKISSFVYIEEGVRVGDNVKIEPHTFIPTGVIIEDDVFIGPGVIFTNDKYPSSRGSWKLLETRVKRGASIGAGAVILPGLTIGEKAVVGAGAVVTKSVAPKMTVIGTSARDTNEPHRA